MNEEEAYSCIPCGYSVRHSSRYCSGSDLDLASIMYWIKSREIMDKGTRTFEIWRIGVECWAGRLQSNHN